MYETNINNQVAVNTGVGHTERFSVPRIVQQGGGWGPMECSNSVDMLGRMCTVHGQGCPPLPLQEHGQGVTLGHGGRHSRHWAVWKQISPSKYCPELRVHGSPMQAVSKDKYLGDIISNDGTNKENIRARVSKGMGILANKLSWECHTRGYKLS